MSKDQAQDDINWNRARTSLSTTTKPNLNLYSEDLNAGHRNTGLICMCFIDSITIWILDYLDWYSDGIQNGGHFESRTYDYWFGMLTIQVFFCFFSNSFQYSCSSVLLKSKSTLLNSDKNLGLFWWNSDAKIKTRRLMLFSTRLAHRYPQGQFSKIALKFLMCALLLI